MASHRRMMVAVTWAMAAMCLAATAWAQSAEGFYRDKQVRFIIGTAAGSDYDIGTRVLTRHLGRHLPGNPTFIVQNMAGSGGIRAINYVYNAAPKDGTVVGVFSRNIPSQAVLGRQNLRVDPRQLGWIGATSLPNRICVVQGTSPVRTMDQVFRQELLVGSTGAGSAFSIVPTVLNDVLKTKFKIIEGYKGIGDILIAMEQGEVGGVCQPLNVFKSTYAELIRNGTLRILFSVEEQPIAELKDVPTIFTRLKSDEDRQLFRFVFEGTAVFGRPYAFAPGVPAERLDAMRKAFAATMKDPAFLAEAAQQKLDMTYTSPAELEKLVQQLYAAPLAVREKAAQILTR